MSYTRRMGSDDSTVLFACGVCGVPYRYPTEMRLHSDKVFRCLRTCDDPTNRVEEDKKTGLAAQSARDEVSPRFKIGVKPSWY